MRKLLIITGSVIAIAALLFYFTYPFLEAGYQRNMDPIRRKHVHRIANVLQEFVDKTGRLPFQEQAKDQPFMVFIGHSPEHEDYFAEDPVLKRGGQWANSALLESLLSKELGRKVVLPRDPQTVPTYAPNLYIYFVSGNEMTVVSHLHFPVENTVEYQWHGKPFYAYSISYELDPVPVSRPPNTE